MLRSIQKSRGSSNHFSILAFNYSRGESRAKPLWFGTRDCRRIALTTLWVASWSSLSHRSSNNSIKIYGGGYGSDSLSSSFSHRHRTPPPEPLHVRPWDQRPSHWIPPAQHRLEGEGSDIAQLSSHALEEANHTGSERSSGDVGNVLQCEEVRSISNMREGV